MQNLLMKREVQGWAVVGIAAVLVGGCSGPPSPSRTSPGVNVPSGCGPSPDAIGWSDIKESPRLERVILVDGRSGDGRRELLDTPVIASVSGIEAPASWLPLLAAGLGKRLGTQVSSTRPSSSYGLMPVDGGDVDTSIPEKVIYQGVREVSAAFSLTCAPGVSGVFTAWTETVSSGVMCGSRRPSADAYAQMARSYCPQVPDPSSAGVGTPTR
ncbi:hypothetical protein [Actinoplanes xinjiangensis]|uniref:hypothetical protein n=1 Tax=Actinoplanes xinjiangensis TaxID=512350 RepID=UPI0011B42F01|nr:hypothetical protein [Actinoplanes xinjiangensis]GIF45390.1 hypothetical protein Axi01nite_97010 [Actinoplanes xinjiangensis]